MFQVELRRRLAGTPLLVLGVTNRTMGYLSPEDTYGTGLYQEQQSPFAPGCLEQTIEAAAAALEELPRLARDALHLGCPGLRIETPTPQMRLSNRSA